MKDKSINVNINGKDYVAPAGSTVLEVIQQNKIDDIPTLCHSERLKPYGSCFLCVVEIEGFASLKPSCATPAGENMRVKTNTARVIDARKTALELILSNHYADCIAPCTQECPAGVDIQGYIALASMGKYEEAVELIKETNPLPLVCGRVCTRPCEIACRRNDVDEGLAIDFLKRYCADIDMLSEYRKIKPKADRVNKRVAIIGSGPAGLSAAYYLSLAGFDCDIYERMHEPGGMLRWGIPAYRLPRDVLAKEISFITDLGAKIYLNKEWGRDFTLNTLKKDYDAVFIAIGSQKSTAMRIKGEDNPCIIEGIAFLREFEKGIYDLKNKRIMIIGGGNTAIDCARTALRLGSDKVILLYRRTRHEMPANDIEIEEALKEGVEMHFLSAPVSAETDSEGRFKGLSCIKMELGEPDASGRRRPVPLEGSEHLVECDMVISAIGQQTDTSFIKYSGEMEKEPLENKLKYTKWNTLEVDEISRQSNIEGIFAGGDIVTGPWIAISAIAEGRAAANGISKYLTNKPLYDTKKQFFSLRKSLSDNKYIPQVENNTRKIMMPELKISERACNFREVELGLTAEEAYSESGRCLSCGCDAVFECDLKRYSAEYEVDLSHYKNKAEYRDQEAKKIHPFIEYELNKCILCGKCVRVCDEVRGVWAISFIKRGFNAEIQPVLDKPLLESNCISCGECLDICPVGALSESYPTRLPGPYKFAKHESICFLCPNLCRISYLTKGGMPISISAEDHNLTPYSLCVKGRFGLTRLHQNYGEPIREKQEQDILEFCDKLKEIRSERGCLYISPFTTNEEASLLTEFCRIMGIGKKSVLSAYIPGDLYYSVSPAEKIEESDLIIVTNPSRSEGNLNIDVFLRKQKENKKEIIALYGDSQAIWNFDAHLINSGNDKNLEILLLSVLNRISPEGFVRNQPLYSIIKEVENYPEYPGLEKDIDSIIKYIEAFNKISVIANSCSINASILCSMLSRALSKDRQSFFHLFEMGLNLRGLYDLGYSSGLEEDSEYAVFYGENPCLDDRLKSYISRQKGIFIIDEFEPEERVGSFLRIPPFYYTSGSFICADDKLLRIHGIPFVRDAYSRVQMLEILINKLKPHFDNRYKTVENMVENAGKKDIYLTNTLMKKVDEFIMSYKLR